VFHSREGYEGRGKGGRERSQMRNKEGSGEGRKGE